MAEGTQVGSIYYDVDLDDKKFRAGADGVNNQLKGLEGAFKRAEHGSQMFAGALTAVGVAGLAAVGFGIKMAADLETMTQGFVTLLGSTEKANEAIKMIQKDAASTPFEMAGLVKANQLLTSVTKDANRSEAMLLNVGKALTAMGKGNEELDRIIVNLQLIGAVGKASMIDIKQFAFAGIPIFEMLKEHTGKTGDAINDMISNGEVSFEMLEEMFNKAGTGAGRFARAFELQGGTFNQLMSNFKDNIAITMGALVKELGIFDAVKGALSDLVEAMSNLAKPESIAQIRAFFEGMIQYLPIIIGFIIGGLTPAFVGLAIATWGALAPLLPFMAVGIAVGAVVMLLVNAFGGWTVVMANLQAAWNIFMVLYDSLIKPALEYLWNLILTQLVPALQELWNILAPILVPVLQFLGAVLVGVVVVAILATIGVLVVIIKTLVDWANKAKWAIETIIAFFNLMKDSVKKSVQEKIDFIMKVFNALPGNVQAAISNLANIIIKPFQDAWNKVSEILDKIKKGINDALNPTVRHSPSLVDNIRTGVDQIIDQYSRLSDLSLPDIVPAGLPVMGQGGGETATPIINVYVDKVGDMQDVNAIGRELGFRASMLPR